MSCQCYHIQDMQVTFPAFPQPRLSVLLSLNSEQAGGLGWQEPAGAHRAVRCFPAALCPEAQDREGQLLVCRWVGIFQGAKIMMQVVGKRGETAGRNNRWDRMFWVSGNRGLQRKPEPVCHRRATWWELVDGQLQNCESLFAFSPALHTWQPSGSTVLPSQSPSDCSSIRLLLDWIKNQGAS